MTFQPLYQPKMVLDLAILEGCKVELTWWWLYPKTVYLRNTVTYLRNNRAVSWLSIIEPTTESRKSNVLTTTPLSHLEHQDKGLSGYFVNLSFIATRP